MSDLVVDIAVPVAVHKTFHYRAPEEMRGRLTAGSRVIVPFGSRRVIGTVVGFPGDSKVAGLKTVLDMLDDLPADLLDLARWMSDYYLHPLGQTIEAMVPRAVSRPGRKKRKEEEKKEVENLTPDTPPELMPEQAEAVGQIGEVVASGRFEAVLLHGVTGSGKTEVYLRVIAPLAGTGKGAIVLVPEIALTPQLLGRFRNRFGDRVAALHSGLTDRERADEYRRIRRGDVDVAVGARSAVFAPFERLGVIIVDEEHENSYKQEEGLRYHARDVAVMRAKLQSAAAVLGSATPSLESFLNARNGKYRYLRISSRVDHRPLPPVSVVDLRTLPKTGAYSPQLIEAIRKRMERGEQTLLLLNRRGFSPVLVCRDCGAVPRCPSCSVSLTFHKAERQLKCHYCDFVAPPPDKCPSCAGTDPKPLGAGTQKIEEDIQALFPGARIARMDSDSVKGRKACDEVLGRMDRREVDILLGTQMVAKGHDFPAVTLVGVVDADVGLNLPDFRSAEKTFQLVTQAAGRSGRGAAAGEVIIQTVNPGHYAVRHSITHDYEGFAAEEIAFRSRLGYPPHGRMVKLEIKSAHEKTAAEAAKTARDRMRSLLRGKEVIVLGPAPSPIAKVRGKYRFHILLISPRREQLRTLAVEGRNTVEDRFGRKCQAIIDVDPVNLM